MAGHKWTPEEDAAIRAAYALAPRAPRFDGFPELRGLSDGAIRSRAARLRISRKKAPTPPPYVRKFETNAERNAWQAARLRQANAARPRPGVLDRIWSQTTRAAPESCWEWQGGRTRLIRGIGGYGRIQHDGRKQLVHRIVFEQMHGPIPAGMLVRHKCDNPPCCNPAHLELGTHLDNSNDMIARRRDDHSRGPRGATHPHAKLNPTHVIAIREQHAAGTSMADLGAMYGVCRKTIEALIVGRTWRHVS